MFCAGKCHIKLPNLIKDASTRWGLTDIQPVTNLSYNFAAFAQQNPSPFGREQGEGDVVLKIGVPSDELTSEMAALKLFNGNGACQLLECDEERGFLLLERVIPGTMLSELEDDDERTNIAVDVMSRLWRPLESDSKLSAYENVKLMHGDFHHFNILLSERGWLAIDPKGVVGPVMYEIGPLMLKPWNSFSDGSNFQACPERSRRIQAERRIRIFSDRPGWEREKIIKWAAAHAVLSAWWDFQDGTNWKYSMNCAKVFSKIK